MVNIACERIFFSLGRNLSLFGETALIDRAPIAVCLFTVLCTVGAHFQREGSRIGVFVFYGLIGRGRRLLLFDERAVFVVIFIAFGTCNRFPFNYYTGTRLTTAFRKNGSGQFNRRSR